MFLRKKIRIFHKSNTLILFFILMTSGIFAQDHLADNLAYGNYATIEIQYFRERYSYTELLILYRWNINIKVHSLVKCVSNDSENIDSIFVLNGKQIDIIESFLDDVKKNKCPETEGIVFAGSRSHCQIEIGDSIYECDGKTKVSLTAQLLK